MSVYGNISGIHEALPQSVSLTRMEASSTGSELSQKFTASLNKNFENMMAAIERGGHEAVQGAMQSQNTVTV